MNDKPRKQLSLRFDNYAELLEEAKKYCEANNITLTDLVANGIRLAMTSHQPSQLTSRDKPSDNDERLANLERRQAELEEQLAKTSQMTSQDAIAPNSETIQEIVHRRTSYLANGMNEVKTQLENEIEFLKTELKNLKQEIEGRSPSLVTSETTEITQSDVDSSPPQDEQEEKEELSVGAIAPKPTKSDNKKSVNSRQAGKKTPQIRTVTNTIYMKLKRDGFQISATIVKNKILELYPNPEDWTSEDARKDVVRALKSEQTWEDKASNFLSEVSSKWAK
jgi:predicted  nucleic acid-binding Zn-ribbon protein